MIRAQREQGAPNGFAEQAFEAQQKYMAEQAYQEYLAYQKKLGQTVANNEGSATFQTPPRRLPRPQAQFSYPAPQQTAMHTEIEQPTPSSFAPPVHVTPTAYSFNDRSNASSANEPAARGDHQTPMMSRAPVQPLQENRNADLQDRIAGMLAKPKYRASARSSMADSGQPSSQGTAAAAAPSRGPIRGPIRGVDNQISARTQQLPPKQYRAKVQTPVQRQSQNQMAATPTMAQPPSNPETQIAEDIALQQRMEQMIRARGGAIQQVAMVSPAQDPFNERSMTLPRNPSRPTMRAPRGQYRPVQPPRQISILSNEPADDPTAQSEIQSENQAEFQPTAQSAIQPAIEPEPTPISGTEFQSNSDQLPEPKVESENDFSLELPTDFESEKMTEPPADSRFSREGVSPPPRQQELQFGSANQLRSNQPFASTPRQVPAQLNSYPREVVLEGAIPSRSQEPQTPAEMIERLEQEMQADRRGPNDTTVNVGLQDERPGKYAKSCDDFRDTLLSGSIRDIALDISPPASANRDQFVAITRSWTDRQGNVIANGPMVDLRRGYVIIERENGLQKIAYAKLSDADWSAVAAYWQIPVPCGLGTQDVPTRNWIPQTYTWKASALCHKPLYFEDIQLERYGHSHGPFSQPVRSAAHFFVRFVTWPYQTAIHPSNECQYALGFYRPGDCAPWLKDPIPISLSGLGRQAIATGAVIAIP